MSQSFVLLRGLIREAGHWGSFIGHLQKEFPEARFECLDIPGAGVHFRETTPLSIDEIVRSMRSDFLRLKLPSNQPVTLIAISLGGMIAAQWFSHYPRDFQSAVLINTSYGSYSPLWQRLKPQALQQLIKVPTLKGKAKERSILEVVSNRAENYDQLAEAWHEIASKRPVSLQNTLRQLWAAARFKSENKKPSMPILILASVKDRMVSVECSRAIGRAWSVPTVEHPTAGHDLPTDEPEWVSQQVKQAHEAHPSRSEV